ncbi:MAG: peptide chain release factor 1 [Halobacteriovoraceae bacterium]|nr:peptide chain release factor 1 [Halobacteriovoraceae bacterium]
MFEKLDEVVARFELLTKKLADPTIYQKKDEFKKISEERKGLIPIVDAYKQYNKTNEELKDTRNLLKNESDEEMKEMAKNEISQLEQKKEKLESELKILLLPQDPLDKKNVMVEIRAGAGGAEASIFVGDVFRMYQNYFRKLNFRMETISLSQGDEGIKEVIFNVTGEGVYSKLKYESGVHRVQRIPKTESQGRVHTSTITVAVMPETEDVDFELDMNDVRIDVFRAGGPGGQSVNTTDSAVRVTHIPTGMVVTNQNQKSQIKNKERALRILKNKIYDKMLQEQRAEEASKRKGLIGTGDRSERIRTYNFPQRRLTDHRIGLTLYSLDKIMEGDLFEVTESLMTHDQAELLKGQEE